MTVNRILGHLAALDSPPTETLAAPVELRNFVGKYQMTDGQANRVARNLRRLLEAWGKTVKDIYSPAGIRWPATIERWLDGTTKPTTRSLRKVSRFFRTTVEELVTVEMGSERCDELRDAVPAPTEKPVPGRPTPSTATGPPMGVVDGYAVPADYIIDLPHGRFIDTTRMQRDILTHGAPHNHTFFKCATLAMHQSVMPHLYGK